MGSRDLHDVLIGVVFAATAAVGGAAGKLIDAWRSRRTTSGSVKTSDAEQLWTEAGAIRQALRDEVARLEMKLDAALRDNQELAETNRQLAEANNALVDKVDELQRDNRELITGNRKLDNRVKALLAKLGEHDTPEPQPVPRLRRRTS